jgi:hypothetical protein
MTKRPDQDVAAGESQGGGGEPRDRVDTAGGLPGEKPEYTGFDSQADLRRRWVAACAANRREVERVGILKAPVMDFAPFAELRCGARGKRSGRPCPHTALYANGRCRWHGGLSTGPRTEAGKDRAAQNAPWRRRHYEGDEVEVLDRDAMTARAQQGVCVTARDLRPHDPAEVSPRSGGRLLLAIRELLESDRSRARRASEIARRLGAVEASVRSGLRLLRTLRKIDGTRPDADGVPTLWKALPDDQGAPMHDVSAEAQATVSAMVAYGMPPTMADARDQRIVHALRAGARPENFAFYVPLALQEAQDPVAWICGAVTRDLACSNAPGIPLRQAFPAVNPPPR